MCGVRVTLTNIVFLYEKPKPEGKNRFGRKKKKVTSGLSDVEVTFESFCLSVFYFQRFSAFSTSRFRAGGRFSTQWLHFISRVYIRPMQ